MRLLSYRTLCGAALACSLLISGGCSNASGGLTPPPAPPQSPSPCNIPYQEKAGPLAPQANITQALPGPEMIDLWKQDAGAYNALYPQFNANIDYAAEKCVARPAPAAPPKPKPRAWWRLW